MGRLLTMALKLNGISATLATAALLSIMNCGLEQNSTTNSTTTQTSTDWTGPKPKPQPQPVTTPEQDNPAKKSDDPPKQEDTQAKGKKREVPERLYQLNDLDVVTIKIGDHSFKTWVMNTASKQQEGMMFLEDKDVEPNEAMIFVYPEPRNMYFWMKNTHIPLDIAFVRQDKVIANVATMKAYDETSIPSKGMTLYAIEFKAGTLKKLEIKAGMKVTIPDSVKALDAGE